MRERERERERERVYGFLRYKTKNNCHPKGRVIPVKYVTQFIEQGTRKKRGRGRLVMEQVGMAIPIG